MVETVFTDFEIGLKNNRSLGMSTKLFDGSLLLLLLLLLPTITITPRARFARGAPLLNLRILSMNVR